MIEVFAVTDQPEAPLPEGLLAARHGQIAGVYAPLDEGRERASAEDLWRHERLVERLMADRAVLPMRYGTILEDEWRLRGVLAERAAEFTRLLDTVRGRVELAVRLLPPVEDPDPVPVGGGHGERAPSGREYMEARLRRRRAAEEAAACLRPLEGLAEAWRGGPSAADGVTRCSYLVERARLEDFNALVRRLQAEHPELRMTCTGPWPPYSFVSEGGDAAAT